MGKRPQQVFESPVAKEVPAALAQAVVERAIEVTRVPAPTGSEAERASLVASWWKDDGWCDVRTDAVGNVWASTRPDGRTGVVLAAHLDTVFDFATSLEVRRDGTRLVGPGIGDDGIGVATLSAAASLAAPHLGDVPVHLLATVGEEGVGDLRGGRQALRSPPGPLAGFIAIEGNYLGRVVAAGVGSVRWRVELSGPGGHAWEQAGRPSAVHLAAGLVAKVAGIPVESGRTSLNVGSVHGGEAINALGRHAVFELDIRGVDQRDLDALERAVTAALSEQMPDGVDLRAEVIGRRPAGETPMAHPLVRAAVAALEARSIRWSAGATSTDANAAHEVSLPAVALGVTIGGGEHTTEEWIDTEPVAAGVGALADTIVRFGCTETGSDGPKERREE